MKFSISITICLAMAAFLPGQCNSRIKKRSLFGLSKPTDVLTPVTLQDFKGLTEQIKGLNTLTARLEKALAAEKEARASLQNFFETAKEKVIARRIENELENTVNPDKGNYWAESTSCGGILIAQTGKIKYEAISTLGKTEKCVWTIRSNLRSKVRVKYIEQSEQVLKSIYVTEIKDLDTNKLSTTRLNSTSAMFEGPLIIIIFLPSGQDYMYSISIEYDGVGKNVNKDVLYRHYHFDDLASSLGKQNISSPDRDSKKSKIMSTFVVNPIYKDIADLNVKPNDVLACSATSSLNFHENFPEPSSASDSCCKDEGHCEKSEFTNSDGIFLITETGGIKSLPTFDFQWNLDTTASNVTSVNTCGGILKGRKGAIEYKTNETYSSNERCVWIIQPTGKAGADFTLRTTGVEPGYDVLTLTPLSLSVGAISDEEPSTYNLTSEDKSHVVEGNVILVTFYSDSLTEGIGFTLLWEDAGRTLAEEEKHVEVIYKTDDEGSYKTDGKLSSALLIVVNPHYSDGSGLNLKLNKIQADIKPDTKQGLQIIGNDAGTYTVAQKFAQTPEGGFIPEGLENSHGVFALMSTIEEVNELDISWKKGLNSNTQLEESVPQVVQQTEGCGGVLKGDMGKIEYKLNETYEDRERCTWVIETSGQSKLSLKLLEDEFESCCDFLIAVPLDPSTGSLLVNNSVKINRENKIASFSSTVVFVTFYSDPSATGTGFSVEFTTGGKKIESPVKYRHQLVSETSGSVSYPSENEITDEDSTSYEILTFIWSPPPVKNETLLSVFELSVSGFGIDKNCKEDSLKLYEAPVNTGSTPEIYSCSREDQSCVCSEELVQNTSVSLNNRGFIGVFRPVASPNANKHFTIDWSISKDEPQSDEESSTASPDESSQSGRSQ